MKKATLLLAAFFAVGLSTSNAAWNSHYDRFHSWNKPISPSMASPKEMQKYTNDVDQYLKKLDAEIEKINAQKAKVISEYNSIASEYNSDQFFHKGTFKLKRLPRTFQTKDKDDSVVIIFK